MEELFDNFAKHIEHMISPKLGKDIKKYIKHSVNSETSPEEYSKVESDIKNIMANYFHNATDKDFLEMATNLFNAYVENDDENLIRSVKYFIRIYTYFQNIKLKKKLFQWRINSLNHSVTTKQTQSNTKVVKNSGSSVFDKLYKDARNKNNMNKKSNLSANNN